ncbi:MAG: hypothetical protein C4537_00260 [Acholeplasma sp.]|jgi:hypothetical protein|nr:MAG: hypothetical protein C4537_00260 [Acholeplasma sp.]
MRKQLATLLFFGSIWGLLEATLGYALHFLPILISGSIMFPLAAIILMMAEKKLKSPWSLMWIGLIAASIKSINFLMPGLLPIKTYNPMIAIMIQSLVMVGVVFIAKKSPQGITMLALGLVSFLWRGLFLINDVINHQITGFNFPQLASMDATIEFMWVYGSMGGLFLIVLYLGWIKLQKRVTLTWNPRLAFSLGMMILAMLATYFIH